MEKISKKKQLFHVIYLLASFFIVLSQLGLTNVWAETREADNPHLFELSSEKVAYSKDEIFQIMVEGTAEQIKEINLIFDPSFSQVSEKVVDATHKTYRIKGNKLGTFEILAQANGQITNTLRIAINNEQQATKKNSYNRAIKDWDDQFVTSAQLEDENGNPQPSFGIYDNMQAHWQYNIPAGTDIKTGDTMTVSVPSVFTLATDITFDIKDVSGNVIGHAKADHTTGKVTVTFTEYAEQYAKNGISGDFKIWVHWDQSKVEQDTTVPVDWGIGGVTEIDINPANPSPDPSELLYKWGTVDANDPTLIHWTVRVNYAAQEIENGVYTDFVGPNQEMVKGSVAGIHGRYNADGTVFTPATDGEIPASSVVYDSPTQFHVNIGDFKDTVLINYDTKATDGGNSSKYENAGQFTGDNIQKQEVDLYTPDNGGGGGGETTETVEGIKTWNDNKDTEGLRPDSITIDLYQNGVKIDSKKVSKETNWTYAFKELAKFDKEGKPYIYTVKEETVENYVSTQSGNDFINTITGTTTISGVKTWDDHDDQDKLRPVEITIHLLANGKEVQRKKVRVADGWKYSFTNLPKYEDGKKISYAIKEDTVPGYESQIDGFNLKNIHKTTADSSGSEKQSATPKASSSSATLPQTGERHSSMLKIMGGMLLILLILVVVYSTKKNKNKN
ncbi:Cna B-type domain-containing protein [Vagococcus entomophilus]|nr:Cna B-type domain-containing protein [Vagococcus entomophilus]